MRAEQVTSLRVPGMASGALARGEAAEAADVTSTTAPATTPAYGRSEGRAADALYLSYLCAARGRYRGERRSASAPAFVRAGPGDSGETVV